jgi:diguanylate cyclase (GGDEF)-like protein
MAGSGLGAWLRLESIKSRIIVFVLLATLVPSLVTGWLFYLQNRRFLRETIAQELQSATSQAAREADLWLKERLYEVRVFASSYVVSESLAAPAGDSPTNRAAAARRLRDYLRSVQEKFTDYEELAVVDPEGATVASSATASGEASATGAPLPEGWLARVRAGEPAIGAPYWDEWRQAGVVIVVQPIVGSDDQLVGAVAATLNFRAVTTILTDHSRHGESELHLVDGDGVVIASSVPLPPPFMGAHVPATTSRELFAEEGRPVAYTGVRGVPVVGVLRALPRLGWGVVAEQEQSRAFASIVRLRNLTAAVGGALLLGIGLIAYLLALSIVRPLDRLTAGAAKVAAGDLEVELPEAGRGELGVMTEIFNHMVARLRASHGELHELSITDSLTGLANRKHLMETLEAEIERCRRYHRPLAIAMVDIDHFKRFNDTFGHLAGDEVLRRLAAIFRASLRSADFAARYGGEEFLIVLPETDAATATEIAERIRARVAAESAQRDAVSPRITVSAGIAEAGEDENLEILIHKADAALYRAKEGGRDRVEIFEL